MGEVYWPKDAISLPLGLNEVYAQTFTPLWSHDLQEIRIFIKFIDWPTKIGVAIQYLKPDGTPTGIDLISHIFEWEHMPYGAYTSTRQRKVDPIRIVKGINYAFLIWRIEGKLPSATSTLYIPAPSLYPRGKLIKSSDGGSTWDTTDLGDMLFGEFGNPPVQPTPYDPPPDHWAVTSIDRRDYNTNACIRVTSSVPCTMQILVSDTRVEPIHAWKIQRGTSIKCLGYHRLKSYRLYEQKENCDSIYHTFFIGGLKKYQKYWFCFTAKTDFNPTYSIAPVFAVTHPGGPTFTTILRPNAPGDRTQLALFGSAPCPDNYCYVKEATPDEWNSCVFNQWPYTKWWRDLYHIPNLDLSHIRPIDQVHLTGRFSFRGAPASASRARLLIKTHGNQYASDTFSPLPPTFENRHWHIYTNPFTNLAWTYEEVNDLQIGVMLYCYDSMGRVTMSFCTQLYCKIYHLCEAYN